MICLVTRFIFKCLRCCFKRKNSIKDKGKSEGCNFNKDFKDKIERKERKIKKLTEEVDELKITNKKLKKAYKKMENKLNEE